MLSRKNEETGIFRSAQRKQDWVKRKRALQTCNPPRDSPVGLIRADGAVLSSTIGRIDPLCLENVRLSPRRGALCRNPATAYGWDTCICLHTRVSYPTASTRLRRVVYIGRESEKPVARWVEEIKETSVRRYKTRCRPMGGSWPVPAAKTRWFANSVITYTRSAMPSGSLPASFLISFVTMPNTGICRIEPCRNQD